MKTLTTNAFIPAATRLVLRFPARYLSTLPTFTDQPGINPSKAESSPVKVSEKKSQP